MTDQSLLIRIFIKSYCGWCHEAIDWLDAKGLKYHSMEVISDPCAMKELRELTGRTMTPTIDVDGEILADFGVDELETWWQSKGFDKPA